MLFLGKKHEVKLEDFCRDFYDNQILNPAIGRVDVSSVYPEYVQEIITKADPVAFANIDKQKLAEELTILRFELFALAWVHKFGHESAITQSIFTGRYLYEKKKDDIWSGMAHYNQAIAHATITRLNHVSRASILRMRADFADLYIQKAEESGVNMLDRLEAECRGRPICRLFSEKAWRGDTTTYFLILVLCHRLGLGYGSDYLGPNRKAQFRLGEFIRGLYDGSQQSWSKIKIKD